MPQQGLKVQLLLSISNYPLFALLLGENFAYLSLHQHFAEVACLHSYIMRKVRNAYSLRSDHVSLPSID